MMIDLKHHLEHPSNEGFGDVLVEQIRHGVDEHHPWLTPSGRVRKAGRPDPYRERVALLCIGHHHGQTGQIPAAKSSASQALSVAVIASGAHLGAASCGIPSGIRPLNLASFTHVGTSGSFLSRMRLPPEDKPNIHQNQEEGFLSEGPTASGAQHSNPGHPSSGESSSWTRPTPAASPSTVARFVRAFHSCLMTPRFGSGLASWSLMLSTSTAKFSFSDSSSTWLEVIASFRSPSARWRSLNSEFTTFPSPRVMMLLPVAVIDIPA